MNPRDELGDGDGALTCADAGAPLRVCTHAGIPGLDDQDQQQEQRSHGALPHLRPLEGRAGSGTPTAGGSGELLARARTVPGSPADDGTYRLPEGEATGRAAPWLLAAG